MVNVSKKYPEHLRRIRFKDPESGKTLVFLTNNTALPALTICALYKKRWSVELFFKWIKQNLRIKRFYGTSEPLRRGTLPSDGNADRCPEEREASKFGSREANFSLGAKDIPIEV